MSVQRFRAQVEEDGARLVIRVPFDPHDVWGAKPRHHYRGTIHGYAVRGVLGSDGPPYSIRFGDAWLRDHPLQVGMTVEVELSPEGPQSDQLADDLAAALAEAPRAKAFFDGLATFYRKKYLRWVDGARRPAVRAERIGELVRLLEAGKKQRD